GPRGGGGGGGGGPAPGGELVAGGGRRLERPLLPAEEEGRGDGVVDVVLVLGVRLLDLGEAAGALGGVARVEQGAGQAPPGQRILGVAVERGAVEGDCRLPRLDPREQDRAERRVGVEIAIRAVAGARVVEAPRQTEEVLVRAVEPQR